LPPAGIAVGEFLDPAIGLAPPAANLKEIYIPMTAVHDQHGQPDPTARFDELAELLARFAADTDGIYRDWLERHVPLDGPRAVDLGCGSGRFTGLLADRYDDVLAIDISARQIKIAQAACSRPNVTYQARSLLDLDPKHDGLFDLAFSVNTLHCLPDYDLALLQVKSLLADGGHAVLVDLVDPGTWASRDWHIQEAFRDALNSYRNRSRDHDTAADVLRLRLHPAWLEHVTTDIPLTRPQFHSAYAAVFPGAAFTDDLDHAVAAMHWADPAAAPHHSAAGRR
jgi:SAM-dependent methyltransferase